MSIISRTLKSLGRLRKHFSIASTDNEIELRRKLKEQASLDAETILQNINNTRIHVKDKDIPLCTCIDSSDNSYQYAISEGVEKEDLQTFFYQKLCFEKGLNDSPPQLQWGIYKARTENSGVSILKEEAKTLIEAGLEMSKNNKATLKEMDICGITLKINDGEEAESIHQRYCIAFDQMETMQAFQNRDRSKISVIKKDL